MATSIPPSPSEEKPFDLNLHHGHKDLVQAVAFNTYGDRCATGSVDGKIRVFNRHKDGTWRHCDTWTAHGGEVLELQWLPASVYPNIIASLGREGWFRLWAEDPSAAPSRRFNPSRSLPGRPAFDTRAPGASPYRSFSMKHTPEGVFLALLTASGRLVVYQNDSPEALTDYRSIDEFTVCERKPARGEEVSFKVSFDPDEEPCYNALRAGVGPDSLGLVVGVMDRVRVYRSRDVVGAASFGSSQTQKEFYLAAEMGDHRGLVRDVAWAPGNIRGYDIIATACQDGYARVFRLDTPVDEGENARSWSVASLSRSDGGTSTPRHPQGHQHNHHDGSSNNNQQSSTLSASLAKTSDKNDMRLWSGQPGQVKHTVREISRLENGRNPVWRVGFDDDGQILGTTGDDGKLLCHRQLPDGAWARSSELVVTKAPMITP